MGASTCGMLYMTFFTTEEGLPDEDGETCGPLPVYPVLMRSETSAQGQKELSNRSVKKTDYFPWEILQQRIDNHPRWDYRK